MIISFMKTVVNKRKSFQQNIQMKKQHLGFLNRMISFRIKDF